MALIIIEFYKVRRPALNFSPKFIRHGLSKENSHVCFFCQNFHDPYLKFHSFFVMPKSTPETITVTETQCHILEQLVASRQLSNFFQKFDTFLIVLSKVTKSQSIFSLYLSVEFLYIYIPSSLYLTQLKICSEYWKPLKTVMKFIGECF